MLKCSSSQLKVSCGALREDAIIFKGLATGSLPMLKWVYDQYKLDLVYFLSLLYFCGEDTRMNLGRTGNKIDHGALYEIPK